MLRRAIVFTLISFGVIACSKNAVTGRSQLKLLPESQLQEMAVQQYQQFLSTNKVVSNSGNRDAEMVKRVGQRITRAVEQYYASKGISDELKGYQWEYNLVDSKEVNAWCMPGGKIVVYTGLLPITQNEASLAAVMGHEVSHAVFNHGNERMSQQMGAQAVELGLEVALSSKPAATRDLFLGAYGAGAQINATAIPPPSTDCHPTVICRQYCHLPVIHGGRESFAEALWRIPIHLGLSATQLRCAPQKSYRVAMAVLPAPSDPLCLTR